MSNHKSSNNTHGDWYHAWGRTRDFMVASVLSREMRSKPGESHIYIYVIWRYRMKMVNSMKNIMIPFVEFFYIQQQKLKEQRFRGDINDDVRLRRQTFLSSTSTSFPRVGLFK